MCVCVCVGVCVCVCVCVLLEVDNVKLFHLEMLSLPLAPLCITLKTSLNLC